MPLMPDGWQDGLLPRLTELYKDLHAHPELSFQEQRTAAKAAELLVAAGYDVTTGVGGHGVVGVLAKGAGPTVMLRADMDALPVREETGLPYASTVRSQGEDGEQVPVMHACGHDMHTACLAGAATVLAGARAEWSGTLLVVFQPAEERMRGAEAMIEDGLFERFPRPDIVLGQHVGPLPAGWLGYREGVVMAGADSATVRLFGRGGHGSRPESTVDPVVTAAATVLRLQGIVAREVPPQESAVVTVGRLQAGTKENVIPDTAELGISLRSYDERTRQLLRSAVERVVRGEALAGGATRDPEITWDRPAPVLVSDPDATRAVVADLAGHFGSDRILPMPLVTASEDVGRFGTAAQVPTVFWFWGGLETATVLKALDAGTLDQLPGNHSPLFAPLIDPTLGTGVEALTVAALGRFAAAQS
ncbi:hippurate hydrolase [Actinacidiphila yanglinensis]|uniref:Hippurate hydrolase n=1 Tax=Actinacidiphila yanglinensis TaxID=310779 RepID=A0A1H6B5F3_9ACTN|nr:amidohydrolase [Actinacidiphila yanglinensis]SEG56073.1 hippurate hydrolase [Actinacidiphila yanglinensis]